MVELADLEAYHSLRSLGINAETAQLLITSTRQACSAAQQHLTHQREQTSSTALTDVQQVQTQPAPAEPSRTENLLEQLLQQQQLAEAEKRASEAAIAREVNDNPEVQRLFQSHKKSLEEAEKLTEEIRTCEEHLARSERRQEEIREGYRNVTAVLLQVHVARTNLLAQQPPDPELANHLLLCDRAEAQAQRETASLEAEWPRNEATQAMLKRTVQEHKSSREALLRRGEEEQAKAFAAAANHANYLRLQSQLVQQRGHESGSDQPPDRLPSVHRDQRLTEAEEIQLNHILEDSIVDLLRAKQAEDVVEALKRLLDAAEALAVHGPGGDVETSKKLTEDLVAAALNLRNLPLDRPDTDQPGTSQA